MPRRAEPDPRDRRVARTRRALREALAALIEERGYDAVGVQDIITRADVGRSTFYQHFHGKEDLFLSRLEDLGNEIAADSAGLPADTGASARILAFSGPMFAHGQENRTVIRALLADQTGRRSAVQAMERMLLVALRRDLAAALPRGTNRVRIEALAHQILGAFTRLFTWWIEDRTHRMDDREVDALFLSLVRPGLAAALAGQRL